MTSQPHAGSKDIEETFSDGCHDSVHILVEKKSYDRDSCYTVDKENLIGKIGSSISEKGSIDDKARYVVTERTSRDRADIIIPNKWSCEGTSCRATTSRRLSNSSSGDYDNCSGCSGECSCSSDTYGSYYEKPCSIADSATLLHKSRWQLFRNYFTRHVNFHRNRKYYRKKKPVNNNKKKNVDQI